MPDETVPTHDERIASAREAVAESQAARERVDQLVEDRARRRPEDEVAAELARVVEREIGSMTRIYEVVRDMTAGVDLAVMSDPYVAEAALSLCETITGRLRTSF